MSQQKGQSASAVKSLPLYNVILVNDPTTAYDKAVQVVMDLMNYDEQRASEHVLEAHTSGRSVLIATHKERAELYQDQFATFNIQVVIESVA